MATEVVMPQMGESIAEGTITKWLVKVGDKVERDQPLFEISTDKVDAEIPSPAAGVLLEIRTRRARRCRVNQVVALIGEAGEEPAAAGPAPLPAPAAAPAGASGARRGACRREPRRADCRLRAAAPPPRRSGAPTCRPRRRAVRSRSACGSTRARWCARSPQAEGVDIKQLHGSGIHGRVTKADIQAHLETQAARPHPPPRLRRRRRRARSGSGGKAAAGFHVAAYTPARTSTSSRCRRSGRSPRRTWLLQGHLGARHHRVPHRHVEGARCARALKDAFLKADGTKLTYMPFIFKAVAAALKAQSQAQRRIDGTNIVYKKDINIGMAVALDWGLIVPVIKNADQMNLLGLAKTANDLADRARTKKLKPDEAQGGHLHDHQPRRLRQPLRHADHQPAAGGDPGHRRHREAADRDRGRGRQRHHRHQAPCPTSASPTTTAWSTAPTPTTS